MKQKAEEIYHRFVNYEWNDVSEGLKKSILEAIETALTEGQKLPIHNVSSRAWVMRTDLKEHQLWTSQWWCDDGDGVELYIGKDKGGFELNCFSGIPASKIYIDVVDFGVMWNKAFSELVDEVEPIQNYTFVQQCIMLADWLCSIFCEWIDVSDYKRS